MLIYTGEFRFDYYCHNNLLSGVFHRLLHVSLFVLFLPLSSHGVDII